MGHTRVMTGTSLGEIKFLYLIRKVFPEAINCYKIKDKKGKELEIDIFIPHLNFAIEYDGVYYHSSKIMINRDGYKSRVCEEVGIRLLRVREKGLPKIVEQDIIYDFNSKDDHIQCFKQIFLFLESEYSITEEEHQLFMGIDFTSFEIESEVIDLYEKLEYENSLLSQNPEVAQEWHPTKNNGLNSDKVRSNSRVKVWWQCKVCNHEWQAIVQDRHRNNKKCANCKSLATNRPELIKEWHPTKNGNLTPYNTTYGSSKKVWWICKQGHEYVTSVHTKSKGSGCPFCNGNKLHENNCLSAINPSLAKEWHPTKNGDKTPENVFPSSRTKRAWWQCSKHKEHIWKAKIQVRHLQKQGCPYCAGKKVSKENSLAFCYPDISRQWHSTKNGTTAPDQVTKSSGKRVWWFCGYCRHEWEGAINDRVRTSGKCPKCKKK